jgi:hypothetical protein
MNNRITTLTVLTWFLLQACAVPNIVPEYDSIGASPFGAYIRVQTIGDEIVMGELLYTDTVSISVLMKRRGIDSVGVQQIQYDSISNFSLVYGKAPSYAWTIPVFTLFTFTHGILLLFTAPINLISTIAVTVSAEGAYAYSKHDISLAELAKFARYPQGLPPGIGVFEFRSGRDSILNH